MTVFAADDDRERQIQIVSSLPFGCPVPDSPSHHVVFAIGDVIATERRTLTMHSTILSDILTELVGIYLRQACISEEHIATLLQRNPHDIQRCVLWLHRSAPSQFTDAAIDELPELEWL